MRVSRRSKRAPFKDNQVASPRWLPWIGPVILGLAGAALLAWSRGKWPDAMVDFGRELYVPWQLASGRKLYTDIAYFNGPLSPWLNSSLFGFFGVSLLTLVLANAVILVLVAAMLYKLLLDLGDRLTATMGTLVFLAIFSCAQYMDQGNYNFITPYSHEMTHGIALSLAALVLLSIRLRRGGTWSLFGCGVAVGLTFLTKAEFFIAVTPAVLVGLALDARIRHVALRDALREGAVLAAGAALPPLAAFLLLLVGRSPSAAYKGLIGSWAYVFMRDLTHTKFYRDISGVSDFGASLRAIGGWSLRYLAFLAPAALIGRVLRPSRFSSSVAAVLLAPLGAAVVLVGWRTADWGNVARPLPLALFVGAGILAVLVANPAATAEQRTRLVLALSFVLYALGLLLKIFFNVRVFHYGFVLAMPATLALVLGLLEGIPRFLDRRGGCGAAFRAAALGMLVALMGVHLRATESWFRHRTVRVGTGADAYLTDGRGRLIERILERLARLRVPGQSMVVLPEGVMLNYLSRTVNPTPYTNFMPPDIIMFGEERIVAALHAHPPDWIVVTDRAAPEYGYRILGADYGVGIVKWIEENYTLVEKVQDEAPGSPQFTFALILRHTGGTAAAGSTRVD